VWEDYERIYLRDFEWDKARGTDYGASRYRNYNGPALLKAWDIFNNKRFLNSCEDCELEHLVGDKDSDEESDEEPVECTCGCDMFSHFSKRWLCIPCLLVEEKEAHDDMQLKLEEDGVMVRQTLQHVLNIILTRC
jgi:hypothetical protein